MNYGRFFEFDFESSDLQKGIVVFNYRWLQCKLEDKRDSPRYPIYLTFTPESILFNLHYCDTDNANEIIHYHNTIIELRLSPNVEVADGLTDSLNNAYSAQFPMKANTHLRTMITDSFESHDCPVDGFSLFEAYGVEPKEKYQGEEETHFLRRVILDFLYDFEFTDVFKNVAFYDVLSVKLKECFLFNALLHKVKYYYYRTVLCGEEVVKGCFDGHNSDKDLKFFFDRYSKVEQEWLNSILDKQSMQAFHESPWFDEAYQELEQVYYAPRLGRWRLNASKKRTRNVPLINNEPDVPSWGEKNVRVDYLKSIGVNEMDCFGLTVSNLLNLIRKNEEKPQKKQLDNGNYDDAVLSHCNKAKEVAKWEVSHYHFLGLWKMWFGDLSTMITSLLVIIFLVLAAFLLFLQMYHSSVKEWSFIVSAIPLIVMLVAMRKVMHLHFRSTWGVGGMAMMMPRLIAAVVTAWFTMAMSEDLFHYFREDHVSLPAIIILTFITLLFVVYESRTQNPFDKWYHYLLSSLVVFAIAYAYSLIVGIMVYDFFGVEMMAGIKGDESQMQHVVEALNGKTDISSIGKNKASFIVQFSFFATFIGVFLQLMFQGKSVTESN